MRNNCLTVIAVLGLGVFAVLLVCNEAVSMAISEMKGRA